MELSKRQWGVIRQIAAEQACLVVKGSYNPSYAQMGLDLGFTQDQIDEVNSIAAATARKRMTQADQNAAVIMVVGNEELRKANYRLVEENKNLELMNEHLWAELTSVRRENEGLKKAPIYFYGEALPTDKSPCGRPLADGDRWMKGGEEFTYFMGQWRRRSELEGFASARKYL